MAEKQQPKTAPVQLVQRPAPECPLSELQQVHARIHHFVHEVAHGVTIEDVLRPGYWKTVWRQLARARHTMVTVIAIDGTWEADLRVVATGDGFARTRAIRVWQAEDVTDGTLPKGWQTEFVGGAWRVRNSDGEVITRDHPIEAEAIDVALRLVARMTA